MKLYYCDVLKPRKACALAKYLGSPVDFVFLSLEAGEQRTPWYLALNPNGKVPVLDTGNRTIWESNAILCFLAEQAGSPLWPDDDRRIEVLQWMSWETDHFNRAAGALYFEYIIKRRFDIGPVDPAVVDESTRQFERFAAVLNEHLTGRDYLAGNALTVADFAVAVALPYADKAHMPLDEFPAVKRWHERLNELPAWRDPFPADPLTPADTISH